MPFLSFLYLVSPSFVKLKSFSFFPILPFIWVIFFLQFISISFLFHFHISKAYHLQTFISYPFFIKRYQPFCSWILKLFFLVPSFQVVYQLLVVQAFLHILPKLSDLRVFNSLHHLFVFSCFFHFPLAFFEGILFPAFFFQVRFIFHFPFQFLIYWYIPFLDSCFLFPHFSFFSFHPLIIGLLNFYHS